MQGLKFNHVSIGAPLVKMIPLNGFFALFVGFIVNLEFIMFAMSMYLPCSIWSIEMCYRSIHTQLNIMMDSEIHYRSIHSQTNIIKEGEMCYGSLHTQTNIMMDGEMCYAPNIPNQI